MELLLQQFGILSPLFTVSRWLCFWKLCHLVGSSSAGIAGSSLHKPLDGIIHSTGHLCNGVKVQNSFLECIPWGFSDPLKLCLCSIASSLLWFSFDSLYFSWDELLCYNNWLFSLIIPHFWSTERPFAFPSVVTTFRLEFALFDMLTLPNFLVFLWTLLYLSAICPINCSWNAFETLVLLSQLLIDIILCFLTECRITSSKITWFSTECLIGVMSVGLLMLVVVPLYLSNLQIE